MRDTPGGLLHALESLSQQSINVQYMYAFGTKRSAHAMIILMTDENQRAANTLLQSNVEVLSMEEVEKRLTI